MNAYDMLTQYYSHYDEDNRLLSNHGKVEFLTTIRYIERYLHPGDVILEIGAGTGRYSHYFAQKGTPVDAVELIPHNIELFHAHTLPGEPVTIRQGNAVDLSFLPDDTYDATLLLGPMYHLFTEEEQRTALAEAVRVTVPGGLIFVAYCMNDATVVNYCFRQKHLREAEEKGLLDRENFQCLSTPEELFVLWRRDTIFAMTEALPVTRLHFVGTDMYTNYFREMVDAMDSGEFADWLDYCFAVCEREDLVGLSHHTLDILRKDG